MKIIKEFFKDIRESWQVDILGKRLRDKKGRFIKRKKRYENYTI